MQPGQTINPDGTSNEQHKPEAVELPQPKQETLNTQTGPQEPDDVQQQTAEDSPHTNFKYIKQDWSSQTYDDSSEEPDTSKFEQEALEAEWTASEYIHNQKSAGWFMALGAAAGVIALLVYVVTQDIVSVVVAIIVTALFGATAAKKPKTLKYTITNRGLYIENKLYSFNDIKSFSVSEDGPVRSIHILPLKRFIPPLTVYYPPENEDQIIQVLGNHVPREEYRTDPIDRLMRRIRF